MSVFDSLLASSFESARERRVLGVVTAKVKTIESDGTYRVEYLSMSGGQASSPARVMTPMAGGSRGMRFFPEVGDEVVVAFELGDTNLPIILGAVWNNDDQPPDQADATPSNNTRTIVSRSGHELTFDDTTAAEKVTIKSNAGHEILLDDSPGAGKISIKTALGSSVVLDDTPPGKVTIKVSSGAELVLDNAGGMVNLTAPSMMTIKAAVLQLEASAITMKTTNQVTTSAVVIDGKPFGLHMHTFCPTNPSGPVMP